MLLGKAVGTEFVMPTRAGSQEIADKTGLPPCCISPHSAPRPPQLRRTEIMPPAQMPQVAIRSALIRSWRALTRAAARSIATASPLPKYISPGV
jgi:hypothetical protein